MAININSEAYCRKAYLNYHCYGNTMGLTSEDMGKITQAWEGKIQSWQATVSSDENEYEFDDSDYSNYKSEGKQAAKEATGHDGKKGGTIAEGIGDLASNAAGTVITLFGSKIAGNVVKKVAIEKAVEGATEKAVETTFNNIGTKILGEKAMDKIAAKGAEKATENTAKEVSKTLSAYAAAVLAIANATKYWAAKPNKEEKEACDALQTEMAGAQATLGETQSEMEAMSDEIIKLSDEANALNEETNQEIKDQKTEYDMYMQTFLAIKEKVENGEELTDSEKALYKSVMGYMEEINASINKISEATTNDVTKLYDEIGTYQEGYDVTAETMGEIQGLTDYAEGFDSATRNMCYVEAAAQSLNATTGARAAVRLFAGPWWNWVMAGLAAAAGASSGIAATQQFQWAGEVGTEIDMRKATQTMNTETMDFYDEEIDAYDGFMQGVEDLEIEMPDDIEVPESTSSTDSEKNNEKSSDFTDITEILNEMQEGSEIVTENSNGTGAVILAPQYGAAIVKALGLPEGNSGGKFGQDAIPRIIAQLVPDFKPEDILKVMNGGVIESSYDASLLLTLTGEDTGKNTSVDNTENLTEKLNTIINFYKPIFIKASQQGWKC